MKVIAKIDSSKYICEVSHVEIEKIFNLYYGKRGPLGVGEEIDLGKGYDFSRDIASSAKEIKDFVKANETIVSGMTSALLSLARDTETQ